MVWCCCKCKLHFAMATIVFCLTHLVLLLFTILIMLICVDFVQFSVSFFFHRMASSMHCFRLFSHRMAVSFLFPPITPMPFFFVCGHISYVTPMSGTRAFSFHVETKLNQLNNDELHSIQCLAFEPKSVYLVRAFLHSRLIMHNILAKLIGERQKKKTKVGVEQVEVI